ncbi:glycosyltransferase family 2 protein [Carnobacteriaceae bacterium 52-44]
MYTVSVIMPVYNNEKTLRKAIESILNQTIYDFELILINDGSTDTSAQICDEYEKLEPLFVEVVHQKRNGFGAARNKGLSIAKGKYIYFASAHDIFDKRMLQANVDFAEEKNADLTVFGFTVHNENSAIEFEQHQPNLPYLPNQEHFRNHYRNFHHFYPYVLFNKLYRRSYLMKHRLKFFNVAHNEEAFFNLSVYKNLESVVFNRISYFIRPIEELSEKSTFKENIFEINIEIAKHLEALLTYWNLEDEFEDLILSSYFHAVHEEVENVCSEHSPLSLGEQEEHIEKILRDKRLSPYLKDFKKIKEKSPYKLALLSILQNGNGKAAIQIVTRTKETKARTSKVVGFFRNIFKTNS